MLQFQDIYFNNNFLPMIQIFNHEDYSVDFAPHDVAVIRIWPPVKFR